MKKIYEKSEVTFSVIWIVIYCAGCAVSDNLSRMIGITSIATFAFNTVFSAALYLWIKNNGLKEKYGLCTVKESPKIFLYYIPLAVILTRNFWLGFAVNMPAADTVCYIGSMLCVGFIEEILFRGFLFKAMSKSGVKSAFIVSSLTFGAGHLLHLFDGSGTELISNLCQVFGAMGIGFMFAAIFYRGGSLIPCIIAHSLYDVFSAFSNAVMITDEFRVITSLIQLAIVVPYGAYILTAKTKNGV